MVCYDEILTRKPTPVSFTFLDFKGTKMNFREFTKIPRLRRECVVTEKIDGTNASVFIEQRAALQYEDIDNPSMPWLSKDTNGCVVAVGSRTRWILPGKTDNYGFAGWVHAHLEELVTKLGPGHHFGEWWGSGCQRAYGLAKGEKRFSLFNTSRWTSEFNNIDLQKWSEEDRTKSTRCIEIPCCYVTPVLARGVFSTVTVEDILFALALNGSYAAPGFMKPEGVVVYHTASEQYFKQTIVADETPKNAKIGGCVE